SARNWRPAHSGLQRPARGLVPQPCVILLGRVRGPVSQPFTTAWTLGPLSWPPLRRNGTVDLLGSSGGHSERWSSRRRRTEARRQARSLSRGGYPNIIAVDSIGIVAPALGCLANFSSRGPCPGVLLT